jgi:Ca2+-binding EF-hand superfamily protein
MSSLESLHNLFSPSSLLMSGLNSQLQTKAMKKMDLDADGGVSQTEFQAVLQKAAGKLGVELGDDETAGMFSGLDADADGALNAREVGGLVNGLLSSLGNAQSFMQSRDAGYSPDNFAARDADGDGMLSLPEFMGASAVAPTARMTVTTRVIETQLTPSLIGTTAAGLPAGLGTGALSLAEASVPNPLAQTAAPTGPVGQSASSDSNSTSIDTLMASLDTNQDGQISSQELTALVSQIETVVKRYNDSALAQGTSDLQAKA